MDTPRARLWRSRWAAIGAAVAVTLGAGGLATTFATSSPSSLVAIAPVRVLDTRLSAMGPALTASTPRLLDVAGTIPTVGGDGATITNASVVPDGATAIVANVTLVSPTTPGFLAVRPGNATGNPTTSSVNATAAGVIVPNSVTVELPTAGGTAGQIQLWFSGTDATATTHVLVDVVGFHVPGTPGPAGPAGPVGPAGPAGPTGVRGLSAWDTIPSGQTVKGAIWYDDSAANGSSNAVQVTLPARAPVVLTSSTVNFAVDALPGTTDDDAACTGSYADPTAPAGKVCIYANAANAMSSANGRSLLVLAVADTGFAVEYVPTALNTDTYLFASWAYTAP